jgi:cyanophycinase
MSSRLIALFRGFALLALIGGACGRGRAADTVLGLPNPRDASRPGSVLLHGGGAITDDAFDRFIELAGGKQARIVLVPSAGYRRADYNTHAEFVEALNRRFSYWVGLASSGGIASFEFLSTDDPADADAEAFVRPLATATGVWFSGGAQSRLHYRFVGAFPRKTRFQVALREVVARGGVVGGMSAGMAALPEVMTLYQEWPPGNRPLTAVAGHGLGLFDGAIVEQHFESRNGRLERFTGLLRDSARLDQLAGRRGAGVRMVGLAVEGSSALVLRAGDRLEVLGAGGAHVFVKSPDDRVLTWHTLKSGDKAALKREAPGNVTLVRTGR